MRVKEGAEEFFLEGGSDKAVLLVHGYTGTPAEMRLLGEYLQSRGYTVWGVRLPGHGTDVEELKKTTAVDWYAAVEKALQELQQRFGRVMAAGLSMGGLLCLKLAQEHHIDKVALLSTPIFVPDRRLPFLNILKYLIPYLPKNKKNYREADKYDLSYDKMPTKPLTSLFRMLRQCKLSLARVKTPVLILQSTAERTIEPRSAQYIYDHLRNAEKRLVWFHNSGHILTLDAERDEVFEQVERFFSA